MAGRGTDIMLGGNPEFMADFELQRRGISPVENAAEYEAGWPIELAKQKAAVESGHEEVVSLGGLYVLGTERHESRRIDNQLRGRSGRQGDPGESRFYLSLQDDLMRRFNSGMVERFLSAAGLPDDAPIESKMVSNAIKSAQTQVEAQNFEIRKNVLKYDDVMNRQRGVIYGERRLVLEGEDISTQVGQFLADTINAYVDAETAEGFAEDWDLEKLWTALRLVYPITLTTDGLISEVGSVGGLDADFLSSRIIEDAEAAYVRRETEQGSVKMRDIERKVLLSVLDRKWREHLYEMDYLQEGIGLRAMAQRDPLVEYQREGYELFAAMMDAIKEELASQVFYAQIIDEQNNNIVNPSIEAKPVQVSALSYSSADGNGVVTRNEVTRNAPCPCGSRKKYKRCHGAA
jgi:preprotein translocase subunit SecA